MGYSVVGIDPSLGAVLAAKRVCRQLEVDAKFVVGDARFLPFAHRTVETVFSYSATQHFGKHDARAALAEVARDLVQGGKSSIQMPNKFGLRYLYHRARRTFPPPIEFEVRYWIPPGFRHAFDSAIGPTELSVDCLFGIGCNRRTTSYCLGATWSSFRLRNCRDRLAGTFQRGAMLPTVFAFNR
jgi:SAM-dependent methyltransferase